MYCCLHCLTGREEAVRTRLQRLFDENGFRGSVVWFPKKRCRLIVKGSAIETKRPLFPGYVFFYFPEDEDALPEFEIRRTPDVIRFLSYGDGSISLHGSDLGVARWIDDFNGDIPISKAVYTPGESIRIAEGPLKGMDAMITKVDRHRKKVWVNFNIDGAMNNVVLDVEFISRPPGL